MSITVTINGQKCEFDSPAEVAQVLASMGSPTGNAGGGTETIEPPQRTSKTTWGTKPWSREAVKMAIRPLDEHQRTMLSILATASFPGKTVKILAEKLDLPGTSAAGLMRGMQRKWKSAGLTDHVDPFKVARVTKGKAPGRFYTLHESMVPFIREFLPRDEQTELQAI